MSAHTQLRAEVRDSNQQTIYSWSISPPVSELQPGQSATFNSAEVNVPAGGDELTITLGSVKA